MKQLTQSEIKKNGKSYKNISSPATSGTQKQITDLLLDGDTLKASTDNGKTYNELSSGSGTSVQPDYNQNDSTAADYIKNRPFYTPEQTKIYEKTFTTTAIEGKFEFGEDMEALAATTDSVVVVFGSVEYSCDVIFIDTNIWGVGNLALLNSGYDNRLPFAFVSGKNFLTNNIGITIVTQAPVENYRIKILTGSKKMPLKYLPVGAATIDFVYDSIDRAITAALNTEV